MSSLHKIVLGTFIALLPLSTIAYAQRDTPSNNQTADKITADFLHNRALRLYEYAQKEKDPYLSRNAYKSCESTYRELIQKFPKDSKRQEAEYRIAVCQMLTRNLDSGKANMERLIRKYKRGHWVGAAAMRMGLLKRGENAFFTASQFFKIASENYEKKHLAERALYEYSRALLDAKRYDLAVEPLTKIAEGDTLFKDRSRYTLAKIHYDSRRYDKALHNFEILSNTPNLEKKIRRDSYLFYGLTLSKTGQEEKALEILERCLEIPEIIKIDKAKIQHELFKILYKKEDHDKIIVSYDRGLYAGEPLETAKTYLYAGYALLKKEHYNRAASAFGTVLDVVPNTQVAFEAGYRQIYCYYQIGSASVPALADQFYNRFNKRDRNNSWHILVKVYKAESLYNDGLIADAAKTYRQINSSNLPSSLEPNFLYKKTICLIANENYTRAVKSASYFLDNYSNHNLVHEMRIRRGNALLASNNNTAAAEDYEKVLEDLPESPLTAIALQGLIEVYSRSSRYEDLVNSCELLLSKFPSLDKEAKAHANYWLGWAHFKLEQFDKAIPPLEQARRLSPDFYKEPAGTRIFYSTYYLKDAEAMESAYNRILLDVPGKYFPPKMLAWLGIQAYQSNNYSTARKVLDKIADRENVSETPVDIWRYLAKSHLELKQYTESLQILEIVKKLESSDFWKADTLLDIATAQLAVGNFDAAAAASSDGLIHNPQGIVEASLRLVGAEANANRGDLLKAKDEYMLIAAKYQDDSVIHPLALWKTAELLKLQDPDTAQAIRSTLKQKYPEWEIPSE